MDVSSDADLEDVTEWVRRLGFSIPEELVRTALLEAQSEPVIESTTGIQKAETAISQQSDDQYNTLLAMYQTTEATHKTGPLSGMSIGIKDNIAVRGLEMTVGTASINYVPRDDALVAEQLRIAGGEIVGKTNMDAFALGPTGEYSDFGVVVNPAASGHIPGGTSSGSAAAVRAGLLDAAIGTDTGGSVRIPASCCGVVGMKPTFGQISVDGVFPLAPSADTVGPLGPDVDTVRRLFEVLTPHSTRPHSDQNELRNRSTSEAANDTFRIGVPEKPLEHSAPEVTARIEAAVEKVEHHDRVEVQRPSVEFSGIGRAHSQTIASEFLWVIRQNFLVRGRNPGRYPGWHEATQEVELGSHIARRILPGALRDAMTNGRAYLDACRRAHALDKAFRDLFSSVDLLLTPTLSILPPKYKSGSLEPSTIHDLVKFTVPCSATGHPAISVPVGTVEGLPVGAQLIGPRYGDDVVIEGAELLEACVG